VLCFDQSFLDQRLGVYRLLGDNAMLAEDIVPV
jgi:hypothetical protein